MSPEIFRTFCLSLPGTSEKMPFMESAQETSRGVLCFYVGTKWFCFVNVDTFDHVCFKSTAEDAVELRINYDGIRPAWHMNKRLWNDAFFNSDVPDKVILQLVENSYKLVLASLTKKEREAVLSAAS